MLPLKRILFPVDFSDRAKGAAHYVEAVAGRFKSDLTLMHVVESVDYLYGTLEFGGTALNDYHAERMERSKEQLDAFLADELSLFSPRRVLLEGDPARRIVEYAHDKQINMVMMPSHGFGPFRRFVLGSVTAKVLHDADCAVWTGVHMEEAPALDDIAFRRIVCAIDLGPQSKNTLLWAKAWAEEYGAEISIVHATPSVESRPAKYMDNELFAALAKKASEEIEALAAEAGVKAAIVLDGGDPAVVVHRAAENTNADLVVIGRGSAAGTFGRLRTHSYSIIRQSPCPVVSV